MRQRGHTLLSTLGATPYLNSTAIARTNHDFLVDHRSILPGKHRVCLAWRKTFLGTGASLVGGEGNGDTPHVFIEIIYGLKSMQHKVQPRQLYVYPVLIIAQMAVQNSIPS